MVGRVQGPAGSKLIFPSLAVFMESPGRGGTLRREDLKRGPHRMLACREILFFCRIVQSLKPEPVFPASLLGRRPLSLNVVHRGLGRPGGRWCVRRYRFFKKISLQKTALHRKIQ